MKRGRTPEEKRDLEMQRLAAEIPNQVVLEAMLRQIENPRMRDAVRERIRPYLTFDLVDNVTMHCRLAEAKAPAKIDVNSAPGTDMEAECR